MRYPPPPGWFPPDQGFPSGGPGPWSNHPFPPGPGGPPGLEAQNQRQGPPPGPAQDSKAGPSGPGSGRLKVETKASQAASASEPKSLPQAARQPTKVPSPPVESKPSAEEVKAAATALGMNGSGPGPVDASKPAAPAAPRNNRVTPVVPLSGPAARPFQLPAAGRAGQTSVQTTVTTAPNSVEDATNVARAAVAVAMAQLRSSSEAPPLAVVAGVEGGTGRRRSRCRIRTSTLPSPTPSLTSRISPRRQFLDLPWRKIPASRSPKGPTPKQPTVVLLLRTTSPSRSSTTSRARLESEPRMVAKSPAAESGAAKSSAGTWRRLGKAASTAATGTTVDGGGAEETGAEGTDEVGGQAPGCSTRPLLPGNKCQDGFTTAVGGDACGPEARNSMANLESSELWVLCHWKG